MVKQELIKEPENFSHIMNIENPEEKQNQLKATQEEINSLNGNETWTLVNPPQGDKVIGSKWTFKVEYDELGKLKRYKARLVAQ